MLGLSVVGVIALPYIALRNWSTSFLGIDAWAYWSVDLNDLYGRSLGNTSHPGAFRYAPPLGEIMSVFHAVPWELFLAAWLVLLAGGLIWLVGPRYVLPAIAFIPVALELYHGNIHILMAAAIVLAYRWPALWAFPILAKVTPGIGALWFLVRREWRSFALAVGTPLVIAAVSYVLAPALWREYVTTMQDNLSFAPVNPYPFPIPIPLRLAVGGLIVAWGGLTDRRWSVPVAITIALPIIWWHGLTVLVACIPLVGLGSGAARRFASWSHAATTAAPA
jgi:hypothetical protein